MTDIVEWLREPNNHDRPNLGEQAADLIPQGRVLAIEATAKAICQQAGTDPADAIMMLMTAAAHLFTVYSGKSSSENILHLASTLGQATVAADDFFCRNVTTVNASGPKAETPENRRDGGDE